MKVRKNFAFKLLNTGVISMFALSSCSSVQHVLPPEGRQIVQGRNLLVTIPQIEIDAAMDVSNMTQVMGGGLLYALADTIVNQVRVDHAEKDIRPLRDALVDYPFDQRALVATQTIAQSLSWLGVRKIELTKELTYERLSRALDDSPGPELLFLSYEYLLDKDFESLEVRATVGLLPKATPKRARPVHRMSPEYAHFYRRIICVVPLGENASEERGKTAALWAKERGRPTERKLDRALAKLISLISRALELTAEQEKTIRKTKTEEVEGHSGKVILADAEGRLLLNDSEEWVYVFKGAPAQKPSVRK